MEEAVYSLPPSFWIFIAMGKMQEEVGIDYWALAAAADAARLSRGKQNMLGFCATLFHALVVQGKL